MTIEEKTKERLCIRISPRQRAELESLAQKHNATITAVVKAAIELLLEQEG